MTCYLWRQMFYFTYGKNKQNKLLRNDFLLASWKPQPKREGSWSATQCTDSRILIRIKMSRIRKTGYYYSAFVSVDLNGCFQQCCGNETKASYPDPNLDPNLDSNPEPGFGFRADPDPDPAQNLDTDPDPDPGGGGGQKCASPLAKS